MTTAAPSEKARERNLVCTSMFRVSQRFPNVRIGQALVECLPDGADLHEIDDAYLKRALETYLADLETAAKIAEASAPLR